jgi:hypothetical protein
MKGSGEQWLNVDGRPALLDSRAKAQRHLGWFVVEEEVGHMKARVVSGGERWLERHGLTPQSASDTRDVEEIGNGPAAAFDHEVDALGGPPEKDVCAHLYARGSGHTVDSVHPAFDERQQVRGPTCLVESSIQIIEAIHGGETREEVALKMVGLVVGLVAGRTSRSALRSGDHPEGSPKLRQAMLLWSVIQRVPFEVARVEALRMPLGERHIDRSDIRPSSYQDLRTFVRCSPDQCGLVIRHGWLRADDSRWSAAVILVGVRFGHVPTTGLCDHRRPPTSVP